MTARARPVSRRWFIGAGAAIACSGLPPRAQAQTASDGFRAAARPRLGLQSARLRAMTASCRGRPCASGAAKSCACAWSTIWPTPTSVHWHGIRLPNAMDGVPALTQPAVAPGASFDYRFRPPDAGTFWYHAYAAGQTDRGLAGALIVEDAQPVDVDRDIALVLTTRRSRRSAGSREWLGASRHRREKR